MKSLAKHVEKQGQIIMFKFLFSQSFDVPKSHPKPRSDLLRKMQ